MILVIGEALIDLIGRGDQSYEAVVGGANANVALALAVRGERQAFLGRISDDGFGRLIRDHLASHGVNLDLAISASEQTSLAVATINEDGVATYSFYLNGTADWGWTPQELPSIEAIEQLDVKAIQFGCLGMAIEPGSRVILNWLRQVSTANLLTLSHDLNIRPAIGFRREEELKRVLEINKVSNIIKASDADIMWLYDADKSAVEEIYQAWSMGKLLVVTRGAEGVSIFRDAQRLDVPGFEVKLADTVGAGDTFMAHFLGELYSLDALGDNPQQRLAKMDTKELMSAARYANAASSIVCERVGCNPPTKQEVQNRLAI
jgi:fructokinase